MSECLEKIVCEECGKDNLQVFLSEEGELSGYCFTAGCGTYVADPYKDGRTPPPPSSPEDKQAKVDAYREYPWCADLPSRKLKADSLKYFGCKMEVSQEDGVTPVAILFPYAVPNQLKAWKIRMLESKDQWCVGSLKPCMPFGWARAIRSGQRTLYITEGEFDAIALWQVLKDSNRGTQYADQNPAVVSLKSGAGSAKKLAVDMKREIAQHFDSVVLCFDMDEPGQTAAEEACRVCPDWKVAKLPDKDANDSLINGASKALKAAVVFRAEKPKNSRVVAGNSLHESSRVEAEFGLSTPWQGLTDLTRGFRRGETWYWGAGVKMGKSEMVNTLGAHMIKEHGKPVFFVKPEEALSKSYKMLASKMVGRMFHDPNVPFDYEAYDRAGEMIGDLALFTDVYQFLNWDNLKEDIIYAVEANGVEDVLIDPITCFTNGMSASDANEFLQGMAAEVSAMAKDYNLTVHLFCHLKAPMGTPHELGGEVYSTQFAGSRGMMRSCNYMVALEGDKSVEKDTPNGVVQRTIEERNHRRLKMLEDREFGATGIVELYWDYRTGLFEER